MPELERYVLHRLAVLDGEIREAYARFDFKAAWRKAMDFAAQELSAFYLDVRKDALYCDAPSDSRRRAARTVMKEVLDRLTANGSRRSASSQRKKCFLRVIRIRMDRFI